MLYKAILACFLVASGDALKVGTTGGRREFLAKAACMVPLIPLSAFAEQKKSNPADIYARADAGSLNPARAIERAKKGELVDGFSATCAEIDKIIEVDREALQFEKEMFEATGDTFIKETQDTIRIQINELKGVRENRGCSTSRGNLKKSEDFVVYKRADEGTLTSARAIERAKTGKLVDGSSATCSQLEKIVELDQKALGFEKQKMEAASDEAIQKIVAKASVAIDAQIKKLKAEQAKRC